MGENTIDLVGGRQVRAAGQATRRSRRESPQPLSRHCRASGRLPGVDQAGDAPRREILGDGTFRECRSPRRVDRPGIVLERPVRTGSGSRSPNQDSRRFTNASIVPSCREAANAAEMPCTNGQPVSHSCGWLPQRTSEQAVRCMLADPEAQACAQREADEMSAIDAQRVQYGDDISAARGQRVGAHLVGLVAAALPSVVGEDEAKIITQGIGESRALGPLEGIKPAPRRRRLEDHDPPSPRSTFGPRPGGFSRRA